MSFQITYCNDHFFKYLFHIFLMCVLIISCNSKIKPLTAQQIIDKSIISSGVDKLANSSLSFDFRKNHYTATRNSGDYIFSRRSKRNNSQIEDQLSNSGFRRLLNSKLITVSDSMESKYIESVNSVHYFSTLPYSLNDQAVQKKLLNEVKINGKEYYKIEISFSKENGGIDHEDVFVYWISKTDFKIDYLAYKFEVNGGGVRFREVKKEHVINGVCFFDYNNFKPKNSNISLSSLDKAYENDKLTKVSEIILKKIELVFN